MQKYTYPRLHTMRTAQGSTVPCVGWNLGFERKLKMTTVKKFRREKRSRRKRYVIIIPPQSMQSLLRRPLSGPVEGLKIQGGRASCFVVAIPHPVLIK